MKVWKSPVFYFGILLVVAVIGLLAAPFVINWNGYRADLEAYGKTLTGREVTIDGPIAARLFPWPRLSADQVKIANPPGMSGEAFASADRITINMTLAGLLQGGLDVESIDVDQPTVNFERLATGEGNWIFSPSADLVKSDILSRVRLDKITLTSGTLHFHDQRRGDAVTLDDVNADVASPGVTGPWRIRARSLYNDKPIVIAVNTATYAEGQPLLFGVKLSSADNSGYVYSFDGAYRNGMADGGIRVEPAQTEDGKTDAEGRIRPLVLTAKAKGNFDALDLTSIQLSRQDTAQGGSIASGSASVRFGEHIDARADLSAAMLDLDALAGAKSRSLLREGGGLAVADGLMAMLPERTSLAGNFKVTALKTDGQTLDNVALALEASREQLKITRFAAGLPGRSDVLFTGNYFPAAGGGELSGDLALETGDLRELAFWLWRDARDRLGALWTGSRGRLKMQTGFSLTPSQLRLTNTDFELDGERGKGALAVTSAGRGAVDLALESGRFDLDSYAPQGVPAFSDAVRQGVAGIFAFALPRPDAPDLRLKLQAGALQLNAVTAENVSVDLQSGVNGLDLRALNIGAVGGARVDASGLILDNGKGADGTITVNVAAQDPGGLIRLVGLATVDGLPPWAQNLGATKLRADIGVKPAAGGPDVNVRVDGTAGDLTITGTGGAAPGAALSADAKVSSPSSARILSLLGLAPVAGDTLPGMIALTANGTMKDGFTASATLQALDARFDYQGKANPLAAGYGLDGTLSLRATDAAPLLSATGLPAAEEAGGVLVIDTPLSWADGKWSLSQVTGRMGGQSFSGTASLTPDRVLDARFEAGRLRLRDVMAAALLDWSGAVPDLESSFAARLPFGLTGQLWLTPKELEVSPQFTARSAEIGIEAKPDEIHLAVVGKDAEGRDAQIDLGSSGTDSLRKLSGQLRLPVDLAHQLALAGGEPVADGMGQIDLRFESEGRSPGAAFAAASGQGSYGFQDLRLIGITPAAFTAALKEAKDAPGITRAFDALRGGEGLDLGGVTGTIALSGGEMSFAPFTHQDGDADFTVKTVADLAQGQIDMEIGLALKARPNMPQMSIAYAGPPMALARSENNSELATSLGVTIMQEGITELERLQKEQERLAKLEEQQRQEDEARLQAYYAQRDELLLRKRELKVHAEMQVMEADRLRRQIEAERAANAEINKNESRQRLRELRTWRRLAKLSETPVPKPVQEAQTPVMDAAPKPRPPRIIKPPVAPGPVILANPPGAPVIISPAPRPAPSQ